MARLLVKQTNFNGGEFTPRLHSRVDVSKYENALETATNCTLTPHGPFKRRNGTEFIAETKDSTKQVRLVRFQFSANDAFILEFGDLYIRFYTTSAQVTESDLTITGITQANPGVVTSTAHGLANGDQVYITGVVGMTEINSPNIPRTVANQTANTFELSGLDTTSFTAYTSGGVANRIFTIVSPYDETEVQNISFIQTGDTLFIAHPDFEPRRLTRLGTTNWDLSRLNALPEPTVEIGEISNRTVTPSATTGLGITFTTSGNEWLDADIGRQIINQTSGETGKAIIVSVSSATVATADIVEDFTDTNAIAADDWKIDLSPISDLTPDGVTVGSIINITSDLTSSSSSVATFRSQDVGRYIIINNGVVRITARNSTSDVDGEVLKSLDSDDETGSWTLEDPTWSSSRGFPRAVGLFEQRLVFGGTATEPQKIWMSETGILDGFGIGANDADSVQFSMSSSEVNQIQWIAASRDMVVGTSGSENTITSGTSAAITPSSIRQRPNTYHGSNTQIPLQIGNEVIFVQQSNRKIRSFRFDFDDDNYNADDLTFLAEHITAGDLKEIAYAQEPDSIIYGVLDNGDMVTGTYNRREQVIGWSRFQLDGDIENVQTISVGDEDQVWIVVERTINSVTRRYVELFDSGTGTDDLDGFSDSFLTLSVPLAITAITQANPAVVTSTAHGLANGDTVILKDLIDPSTVDLDSTKTNMSSLNQCTFTVANQTANTFELTSLNTSAFNAYGSGGNAFDKVTAISGLTHLEGKVVQIKIDGASHPDKTVSSGAITLDTASGEVVIGLQYEMNVKTLRKEYDIGGGSMQGQRTRQVRPIIRVFESAPPLVNGGFVPARKASDKMNKKVPLFTGDLEYGPQGWDTLGQFIITQDQPFPCEVTGIFGTIQGNIK